MPYQPYTPHPYLETIDASDDNIFTCVINPRDIITKYELKIYNNNDGSLILTVIEDSTNRRYYSDPTTSPTRTDTTDLQIPFYGTTDSDEYLQIPIYKNQLLNDLDLVWSITLYSSITDYVESSDYFFKTRNNATITMTNADTGQTLQLDTVNNITSSKILLRCQYTQAQQIRPSYYRFNIYLDGDKIYETGDIISSNIRFDYESLVSGNTYELEFIVGNEDHTEDRYTYILNVSYDYRTPFVSPTATSNNELCCVDIDFSNNITVNGKYNAAKAAPSYIQHKETKYILLSQQPDDWVDNYSKYYKNTGTSTVIYTPLASSETFASNKYYKKEFQTPEEDVYNSICIPRGQSVFWDEQSGGAPLNINDTEQLMGWHGHEGFTGVILTKYNPLSPIGKIIVGHEIPNTVEHSTNDEDIYTDTNDPAMPVGVVENDGISAGFYYKYGSDDRTYISEFTKISSAVYRTDDSSISNVDEDDISIDEDTLYILNDTDELDEDDILIANDTTYNHWWTIAMLSDSAVVKRHEAYSDTVIS